MNENSIKVCSEKDIAEGEIKAFGINGSNIILARRAGRVYALEDTCSHDGARLSDGDLVDGQIQCSRHGGRFDLETGEVTQMPAVVGIDSFKVEVKDGDIYVSLEK
jgi:3-phenylpropionate/trans-cinnamate dioxygenase ferredoxin subunit